MDKTSQKIDTLISGFKSVVAYLLTQGFDVDSAIEQAYQLYPVMDGMKESIVDDMVKAFTSGYMNAGVAVGVNTGVIPFSSESISTAMQKAWAKDNLNLSTRLHSRGQVVRKEVGDILKATIGKGNTNKKIASELFNRGAIDTADLPQFMDQVAKLPIDTSAEEKRKLLRKVQRQVSKRTTTGLRAGYSEVIKAVESDNENKLAKAIEVATEEKTRYHAERIARTETARAYADGQVSRYKDDDDIVAFQWKLGTRHPVFDICDFYANADLYGMGKGVFPKDKVPTLPAHPHCMCRLKPIVDGMIDNSAPKDNINDGGMDLLKSLSVKEQERLLGVHGRVAVLEGKARWQDHLRGWDNGKFEVRTPKRDYKRLKEGVKGVKVKQNNVIDIAQLDETLLKDSNIKLLTKNLVLTDNSIIHIKERHPNDYVDVIKDLANMVQDPDSIMIGNKPHTLVYMARNGKGHMYQVVIRLKDEDMSDELQNSIITLNRVNEKRYKRYKKSRKIIYKKEENDV